MMYPVRVPLMQGSYQSGSRALEMVSQLRQSGLIIDRDFVWRFEKGQADDDSNTVLVTPSVTFVFQDPALATFYQLKWSRP